MLDVSDLFFLRIGRSSFHKGFFKGFGSLYKANKKLSNIRAGSFFFFENFKLGQPSDLKVPVLINLSTIGCSRWFPQTGYDNFFSKSRNHGQNLKHLFDEIDKVSTICFLHFPSSITSSLLKAPFKFFF